MAASTDTSGERRAQDTSLGRGLELLLALGEEEAVADGRIGVGRLAERVSREKSQVSRAMRTLAALGFADRDPETGSYRLGWRLFVLAARAGDARLLSAAPVVLADLVRTLGETAHLSVLDGTDVMTVLSEQSPAAIRATGWSGRKVPAYCTSSGRALLLDHTRDELVSLFGSDELPPRGPGAPRDARELHRRIVAARPHGFAVVDQEFERGLVGVAAPVRDFRGRIVAVLNVSAPKFRFGTQLETTGGREVKARAAVLSRELGWIVEKADAEGADDE